MRRSRIVIAALPLFALTMASALVGTGAQALASPPPKGIDPEADRMLRQMADYLAGQKSFTVQNFAVDERTLKSGEKIQVTSDSDVAVQRPNHLRSTQRGQGEGLGLWYDGKTMTIACKATGSYETVDAPAEIDAAIDKMRQYFKIDAPGADLLYSRPYDILTEQVVSGRFVGRETIQGAPANHLAFQGEDVDFQLWIQDGSQPLPLRFVITTKTVKERPQFTVQLSNWNLQPNLSAPEFAFAAPTGAKPITSVTSSCLPGTR